MSLSDTAVQAAKPVAGSRITKLHDRDGLFLHVASTGTKIHGKERSSALGRYPAVSLKKARARAQEARVQVADGRLATRARLRNT